MTSEDSAYDRGMKVRREVLGDEHVDRAIGRTMEFTADFQDFIPRYAWGEVWAASAWTAGRGAASPSPPWSRWAGSTNWGCTCVPVRNGLTEQEIGEVFLQSAVYCGVPAANLRLRCG